MWHGLQRCRHVISPSLRQPCAVQRLASASVATPATAIHLYRQLLRECRDLPNLKAQSFFRQHVRERFRRAADNQDRHDADRVRHLLRKARNALSTLRRANQGAMKPLLYVLRCTYGRIGKRRHVLLEPLMRQDASGAPQSDMISLELDEHPTKLSDDISRQIPRFTPQLMALYKSQQRQNVPTWDRPHEIRQRRGPIIPHFNIWKRAMPAKRVKNIARRWYQDALSRLWAPLPVAEADELKQLARAPCAPHKCSQTLRRPETNKASALDIVLGLSPGFPHHRVLRDNRPHRLTPRYMRRRHATILTQTSVISTNEEGQDYQIEWPRLSTLPKVLPSSDLFAALKRYRDLE